LILEYPHIQLILMFIRMSFTSMNGIPRNE
jgi:hypothetical protein